MLAIGTGGHKGTSIAWTNENARNESSALAILLFENMSILNSCTQCLALLKLESILIYLDYTKIHNNL